MKTTLSARLSVEKEMVHNDMDQIKTRVKNV